MTFELKTISPDAVPRALARAERYRLLNEPAEAESICLDVLRAEPDNTEAMVTLILALTDQFDEDTSSSARQALDLADRLSDPYDHAYYSGIVWERQARAELHRPMPGLARCNGSLRAGRSAAPGRERRSDPPLEHVRASDHARQPAGTAG